MYELIVQTQFSAAHRLRDYDGPCENLHGHNYLVEVCVGSSQLDELGMVMDFKELKGLVRSIVDGLDHRLLNEVAPFDEQNPTTELIGRHVAEQLETRLPGWVGVREVVCWETPGSGARYIPSIQRESP